MHRDLNTGRPRGSSPNGWEQPFHPDYYPEPVRREILRAAFGDRRQAGRRSATRITRDEVLDALLRADEVSPLSLWGMTRAEVLILRKQIEFLLLFESGSRSVLLSLLDEVEARLDDLTD
jgi:hypothetical protein